jgi:hypothetical protein
MTSEQPWQTLAACKEVAAAVRSGDPSKYVSHYPVHQDGSCNGLQHYAALGRDVTGARSVNLKQEGDFPADVYSDVVDLVSRAFNFYISSKMYLLYTISWSSWKKPNSPMLVSFNKKNCGGNQICHNHMGVKIVF